MTGHYRESLRSVPVPKEDIGFFSSIPLFRWYLSGSSPYRPVPFITRHKVTQDDTSDTFFSQTINSRETIPPMFALMRECDLDLPRGMSVETMPSQGPSEPYYITIAQLESGVNGYRDTLHGGVLAALFDEALGLCVEGYREAV